MENLEKLFAEVKDREFRITTTAKGVRTIQQTERNQFKADIMTALLADLNEKFGYAFRSADGVLLEIENEGVADLNGKGITICFDVKVKDLDTDAEYEGADYAEQMAQKQAEKALRAEKAKRKAEKDRAKREAK